MEREIEIGVRELKAKLSEVVASVRRGRTVRIALRGRGVARIVPLPDGERSLDERLAELEQTGLVGPAPRSAPLRRPLRIRPRGLAQRFLSEDRG
jgi:prevent-host-death family protein